MHFLWLFPMLILISWLKIFQNQTRIFRSQQESAELFAEFCTHKVHLGLVMKYQKILERERKNEDAQIDICESAQLRGSNQTQGAIRGDAVPIIKRR